MKNLEKDMEHYISRISLEKKFAEKNWIEYADKGDIEASKWYESRALALGAVWSDLSYILSSNNETLE